MFCVWKGEKVNKDDFVRSWKSYKTKSIVDRQGNKLPIALYNVLKYSSGFEKHPEKDEYYFVIYSSMKKKIIEEVQKTMCSYEILIDPTSISKEIGLTPVHQSNCGILKVYKQI